MTPAEMPAGLTARLDGPHSDEDTAAVAGLTAEAVRFLAYATGPHASGGLTDPATAYQVTGSLSLAAFRLDQCFARVTDFLDRELAAGRLGEDSGRHPALAVERARRHLEHAAEAARALNDALSAAQNDLAGLHQTTGRSHHGGRS
jgi:hypothetical protein